MPYQLVNPARETFLSTGLGINLPFTGPMSVFNTTYTSDNRALANLKNLLLTYKGERLMQPEFGTELPTLLFEPNTADLKMQVSEVISEAVEYWLPYINIVNIDTITAEDDPNLNHEIQITITFSVDPIQGVLKNTDSLTNTNYDTENNLSNLILAVNQNQLLVI